MTLTLYLQKYVALFVGDSWISRIAIHIAYLPVKNEFDITTYTPWSLWPVVFIARQFDMYAERDIVLPIPSVCLSAQCQYVRL